MLPGGEKEIADTTSFRCAMRGFKEQTGFNIEKKDVLSIVHHVYNNPDLNSNTVLYIIKSKQTFPTYDATKTNGEIDAVEYVPITTVKEFRKNIKDFINKYLLEIQKASLI
jgi:ADP-ribose pyrophosphatase YjhB (NUDIX family)